MPLTLEKEKCSDRNIEQLKSLRSHLEEFAKEDLDWKFDILALDYAIDKLGDSNDKRI
ncbi:hypothetical protein [Senegalia massiliensis]|uniref:hypothetical protein n=1 Tax=Senegalia massiliensis TaxID=1720316 RepID=UPI001362BF1B|nr:hypothetical protein [Senegalia massiliensis]